MKNTILGDFDKNHLGRMHFEEMPGFIGQKGSQMTDKLVGFGENWLVNRVG